MRRYGHEGFPVVQPEGGRDDLLGVITRREADRAINHGLGRARAPLHERRTHYRGHRFDPFLAHAP